MRFELTEEDPINSCKTIVGFINKYNLDNDEHESIRRALLQDLCWKSTNIPTSAKAIYLAQGLYHSLPRSIRDLLPTEKLGIESLPLLPSHTKKHINIGIVTILKAELDGVLKAFDIKPQKPVDTGLFQYWTDIIDRIHEPSLSVVVTMVGRPRNVPCAIAVEHMLNEFAVDLMILVGIAAGPEDKVKLGSVVAADRVYDYEHVRSELINDNIVEKPRPLFIDIPENIYTDLGMYNDQWLENYFAEIVHRVDRSRLPHSAEKMKTKFHRGTIAAGERLFADGSLNKMRNVFDERVRAGAQEDSGFAQACEFRRVQWCIFRGIADYGDPKKNNGWHFAASLAAASAANTFLKNSYRLPSNENF